MNLTSIKKRVRWWKTLIADEASGISANASYKEILTRIEASSSQMFKLINYAYEHIGVFTEEEIGILDTLPYYNECRNLVGNITPLCTCDGTLIHCEDNTPICISRIEPTNIDILCLEAIIVLQNLPPELHDFETLHFFGGCKPLFVVIRYADTYPENWIQAHKELGFKDGEIDFKNEEPF